MRLFAIISAALLATACGSSSSSSGTPLFGGAALSSVNSEFVAPSTSAACSIEFEGSGTLPFFISALKIDFTSWANACNDYNAANTCGMHPGGQSATILLVTLGPTSAVPVTTGTYTIYDSPSAKQVLNPAGDQVLYYQVGYAEAVQAEDANGCESLDAPANSTGTVTLTSVSATSVSGSVSVQFQNGYTLSGDFTGVPACSNSSVLPLCSLAQTFANALANPPAGPTVLDICVQPTTCP